MLAIVMLTAASMSTAHPKVRPLPIRFELASLDQSPRADRARRRWLNPRIDELPDEDKGDSMFRFKGTKVRLKVPI